VLDQPREAVGLPPAGPDGTRTVDACGHLNEIARGAQELRRGTLAIQLPQGCRIICATKMAV
jgi:hypothetical protein